MRIIFYLLLQMILLCADTERGGILRDGTRQYAAPSQAGSVFGSPSRRAGSPSATAGPRRTSLRERASRKGAKTTERKRAMERKRGTQRESARGAHRLSPPVCSTDSSSSPVSESEGESDDSAGKWDLLNDVWPVETRPSKLQVKEYVEKLSWETLNALQDRYEKAAEKKGVGAAIFGRDRKLKKIAFGPKSDDGFTKLHPARY